MAATDPMPETHLHAVFRDAVDHAVGLHPDAERKDQRVLHRDRSQAFVASVAEAFQSAYAPMPDVRVFWRGNDAHRGAFGLNEFLYDIAVCREKKTIPSARAGKEIPYVAKALWLVESEFARDSRRALLDFSKLVVGRATHKLFIAYRFENDVLCRLLAAPAGDCCAEGGESLHLGLVSHPSEWGREPARIEVFRFSSGQWVRV